MYTNEMISVARNGEKRAIAKTVMWRVLATLITGIVAFIYTGEFKEASKITVTAALILTAVYYFHERFWQRMAKLKKR